MSAAERPDPQETCWTIIAQAAQGQGPARSLFGQTYLPIVRAFLATRWRGTPLSAEIDDAVQEVFVECYREDGPLLRVDVDRDDFRGYLMGITRNIARRVEQKVQRGPRAIAGDTFLGTVEDREEDCSARFDREWAKALMREAVQKMELRAAAAGSPAKLRVELLRRRFGRGERMLDIATEWNVTPKSLDKAYAKARDEFRSALRQVVSFHVVRTEADLDEECRRLLDLLRG